MQRGTAFSETFRPHFSSVLVSRPQKEAILIMKKLAFLLVLTLTCSLLPACRQEEAVTAKPVIYLYPEAETEVTVTLDYDGELTCTYPTYNDGWTVTAQPNGILTDAVGQAYNYLYWEGVTDAEYDFSEGFCVPGGEIAAFLEAALAQLGLSRREANEFIVYWLPMLEANPYNLLSFQTTAYTDAARLTITPEPDSLLRVFLAWRPLQSPVEIPAQTLPSFERTGFTVVEWGGAEIS